MTNKDVVKTFTGILSLQTAAAQLAKTNKITYCVTKQDKDRYQIRIKPYDADGSDATYDDSVDTNVLNPKIMICYEDFMKAREDFMALISTPLEINAELLPDRWFIKGTARVLYWLVIGD